MAELAQEMLESDLKVGSTSNEREDPVYSMNNLRDVPFTDFLILHKIFPKIFLLEMDIKHMQKQNSPSRKNLHNTDQKDANALERKQTVKQRMANQESMKLQKALHRRHLTQKMHSFAANNSTVTGQNLSSLSDKQVALGDPQQNVVRENCSSLNATVVAFDDQSSPPLQASPYKAQATPYHSTSPGISQLAVAQDAAIKVIYNEKAGKGKSQLKDALD